MSNQAKRGIKRKKRTTHNDITNVLKAVAPDKNISESALKILNDYMYDMNEAISTEASKFMQQGLLSCLSEGQIKYAISFYLPKELAKRAVTASEEAMKELTNTLD